ncbi:MAG: SAM-dependent DNA methyltransferase [Peptococcaceae bacterium]|nr:SAM-dependent DNA methyltransferase [Peptococcaceae bacterium]
MDQQVYNKLISFIWGIANDCLVDIYPNSDYRKIILPMMVIRRFDAVLEPTKEAVRRMKADLDAAGIPEQDDALCTVAREAFCNYSDFTLRDLKSRTNQQQLKTDFIAYLDGFTKNVQDIITKFKFREQIDTLSSHDVLGLLISKFIDPQINLSSRPVMNPDGSERLPGLDNHSMGTAFEEIIRMFNEQTNITDAGRHFTPRDIVELMADLAFVPVADRIKSTTYRIYDGACGTGGMLTVAEERISEMSKKAGKTVSIYLYGQENADETYAIARADMLVKGEGKQADNIKFGSTISDDKFPRETFDFMISNPPFGTSWKSDLKAWGDIKKEEITDSRFVVSYGGNSDFSLLPDIGDPQMLFLANNVSKMKTNTTLGSRIVEVHNSSSLFTGKAGQGPSNLRRYIIDQDLLEAIVALPENMFYNTGIGTFLWIVANKKSKEREGKIQLIDATSMKSPLRKNLGEKKCEISRNIREEILRFYMQFENADEQYSMVFNNSEFGYWSIDIMRPLRLAVKFTEENLSALLAGESSDTALCNLMREVKQTITEEIVLDYNAFMERLLKVAETKGVKMTSKRIKAIRTYFTDVCEDAEKVILKQHSKENANPLYGIFPIEFEIDKALKDTELVPFTYDGGVEAFFRDEILPYTPDAWIDKDSITIGYELSFAKYFYKPVELRTVDEIIADIVAIEKDTDGILAGIISEVKP